MKFFVHGLLSLFLFFFHVSAQAAEILMVTWQGRFVTEKAFEKRMHELRPDIRIRYIDATRNKKELADRLRNYDLSNTDLIYSFGTTGTKLVQQMIKERKPIVFNMVSAPVLSGIVDRIKKPGRNITGARLLVDLSTQMGLYRKIRKINKLALWFDPREKQSAIVYKAISIAGKAYGIDVYPFRIIPDAENSQRLIKKAAEASNKMDALYFVSSSSFAAHAERLFGFLDRNLLVLGSMNTDVLAGATIALGPDLNERGRVAADIADKILKGHKAGDIPVSIVDEKNAVLFVNKQKKDLVGLKGLDKLGLRIVELEETGLPK